MPATLTKNRGASEAVQAAARHGGTPSGIASPRAGWTRIQVCPSRQREENSRASLLERTRVVGPDVEEGPDAVARYNVLVQLSNAVLSQARPITRGMFGRLC